MYQAFSRISTPMLVLGYRYYFNQNMKKSLPAMLFMVGSLNMLPNQEKAAACSFDQDFVLLFRVIIFLLLWYHLVWNSRSYL